VKNGKICTIQCMALLLAVFGMVLLYSCELTEKIKPFDEKIYWNGSIDDDFCGNSVIVVMDKNFGGPGKVHKKSFFRGVEIESIYDLTWLSGTSNSPYIDWEVWRQILLLNLPGDCKNNVVESIRKLEIIIGIISAEPNYFGNID
jgi:hypothetical protein